MKILTIVCAYAVLLLLCVSPSAAAWKPKPASVEVRLTIDTVSINNDTCLISARDASDASLAYWMNGWVFECKAIYSHETLPGYFVDHGSYTFFYFDRGYKDRKGREEYSRPFTVITKTQ